MQVIFSIVRSFLLGFFYSLPPALAIYALASNRSVLAKIIICMVAIGGIGLVFLVHVWSARCGSPSRLGKNRASPN